MNEAWKNTMTKVTGIFSTDENGDIVLTAKTFKDTIKYTATIIVADNSPLNVLRRKNYFVFVDGIREKDKEALDALKKNGTINAHTMWVVHGHLVVTPGKPGMNDMYNLKVTGIELAEENASPSVDLEAALTKEEWNAIRNERFSGVAPVAPTAPSAPVAPVAPF